ncbi:MAG TPA: GntR family transcriptional regulator [Candidatus Limnocylindrales bacterium]|nr:GntR family transcriptional regulator [Candidatus Limnocylindrales bacterium]
MTRQAVSRSVLSDQVKDRLLQAILDGRYPPGARIVETRVARELGTSQAPVREALRDLEGLGLVVTAAFRGARVRRPSADELLEAFAVRAALESLAIELAIPRLGDDDLEAFAVDIGRMQDAADAGDVYAEATADAAFHGRIVEAAGNATLVRVWRTLEPFSRTYITIGASGADRRQIADGHLVILETLRRREAGRAADVIVRHFQDAAAGLARHWATSRTGDAVTPPSDARGDGDAASLPQLTRQPA